MGKIADALERHNKEKASRVEFLTNISPQKPISEEREISFARELCALHDCSPKVVVLSEPDSADAENFRILRAQILFARDGKRPRTIMVTSPFPGEGKTFVAANLAASIALGIDEYVLLVDCDLRRPTLHSVFNYPNRFGLMDHLKKEKHLEEMIIHTQVARLSLLPAGNATPSPAEIMSSTIMEEFMAEVKNRYQDRFIIIDSAPCQATAEANVLAKYVDGIILVVRALKSPRRAVHKAVENLGKEKILGIVFNGHDISRRTYNKYYEKYYKGKR